MGPNYAPKVLHPGPKQRSTGGAGGGRMMDLEGDYPTQMTRANDKMSIENSGATPNSNRKSIG